IIEINKKNIKIKVLKKNKEFSLCPDIWLLFAPLKKDKTDFVIEKATELGCRRIIPVITQYTNTTNVKTERYIAQSIEAAEQCRRTDLPDISETKNLSEVLKNWPQDRLLYFMDETLKSQNFFDLLQNSNKNKAAILIGPVGGFSEQELQNLKTHTYAKGATLGPRILRAETAAVAALSCWQMIAGDWSKK
ncbi:MAG: 16S rRNA (uracil(1498)-N(3))-methyltransferase, partial [Alphaproteobacteria bacterium]|nr:16S rRNA (uracil(1498)-N(3))-methyltransferase [Alphaproteobacteria bacterium]